MPASPADKPILRAAALTRRQALEPAVREAAARAIARQAHRVPLMRDTVVSGYLPIRGELDPRPLMHELATRGAALALPTIAADGQPMIFRAWRDDDELHRGPLGIREPATSAPIVVPDVVLVPLAAFDRRGHRIGYGAGYFDRALAGLRLQKAVRAVGVAFAIQEIAAVPDEPHDVPLDLVLTENEVITPRRV